MKESLTPRVRNKAQENEYSKKYRQRNFVSVMIQSAKRRAKLKNMDFDLDQHRERLERRIEKMTCELTGVRLLGYRVAGKRTYNTLSFDRKDNKKGYVYSNIRIVCWAMNCALGTWGQKDLEKVIKGYNQKHL